MLDALAGMDQKDNCAPIVSLDSYMFKLGFTGYDAPRVMFPSTDAKPRMLLRHGRYGPERTVAVACTRLVLVGTMHLTLCSLPWFAGPFLDPMVQTVQNAVEFTQVQFLDEVVFLPVVGQRLALTVQTVPKPVEFI